MNMEELRIKVLEKGKRTKDKRTIGDIFRQLSDISVEIQYVSPNFQSQVMRDIVCQYKFYDALCMWLGQSDFYTHEDDRIMTTIANIYLNEKEPNV